MAIVATISTTYNNPSYKSWTVTCADADTSGTFAHGFGAVPDTWILTELVSGSTTARPGWAVTAVSSTVVTLAKQNAVGSGGTTPGTTQVLKITIMRPNSAIRG